MKYKTRKAFKYAVVFVTVMAVAAGICTTGGSLISTTGTTTFAEDTMEDYQEKIEEYQKLQDEYDQKIAETEDDIEAEEENQEALQSQIDTVQATIYEYSKMIADIKEQMDAVQAKVDELDEQISETQATIDEKKEEIDSGVSDFKARLRAMYIAGDSSYTSILLGATDFYDALMKVELIKRVAKHDDALIDSLVAAKDEYEAAKVTLEEQKSEQEAQMAELEEQKSTYDSKKAEQQTQVDKLNQLFAESEAYQEALEAEKEAQEAQKEEYAAQEQEAQEMWNKLYEEAEAKRKAAEAAAAAAAAAANSSSTTTYSNTDYTTGESGNFIWPVPGHYYISYGVGYRWGSYHAGIDIYDSSINQSQIIASDAGTVVVAQNTCPHNYGKSSSCGCGGGYGRYCIVDHGNGYMTLYGHMTDCIVTVGQEVEQGETLGYVGSTGYSTGPHLHFEVRLNGVAQNPENYVSP